MFEDLETSEPWEDLDELIHDDIAAENLLMAPKMIRKPGTWKLRAGRKRGTGGSGSSFWKLRTGKRNDAADAESSLLYSAAAAAEKRSPGDKLWKLRTGKRAPEQDKRQAFWKLRTGKRDRLWKLRAGKRTPELPEEYYY